MPVNRSGGSPGSRRSLPRVATIRAPTKKEMFLWRSTGFDPIAHSGSWYLETGSGMGATLNVAANVDAYVLADRATWIAFMNKGDLVLHVKGDEDLFNQYGVTAVNPERFGHVRAEEARIFVEWLLSEEGQAAIASHRINGKQLFFPNALPPGYRSQRPQGVGEAGQHQRVVALLAHRAVMAEPETGDTIPQGLDDLSAVTPHGRNPDIPSGPGGHRQLPVGEMVCDLAALGREGARRQSLRPFAPQATLRQGAVKQLLALVTPQIRQQSTQSCHVIEPQEEPECRQRHASSTVRLKGAVHVHRSHADRTEHAICDHGEEIGMLAAMPLPQRIHRRSCHEQILVPVTCEHSRFPGIGGTG